MYQSQRDPSPAHRSSSFLTMSTTSSGIFSIFLRLRSTVTPGFRLAPTAPASATWFSLSSAFRMASRAREITCEGGNPLEAERFELEAALGKVGTGGVRVGPLEVAAELGTGRRPDMEVSDTLLVLGGAEAPGGRSGMSMAGSRGGEKTMVDAGTIWAEVESPNDGLYLVTDVEFASKRRSGGRTTTRRGAVRLLQPQVAAE